MSNIREEIKRARFKEELNSVFKDKVTKWFLNKEYLGFSVKISTKNQKISPVFSNVKPCYKKALDELTMEIIKMALSEITRAYCTAIENVEKEKEAFRTELDENMDFFLQTLFDDGLEKFCDTIDNYVFKYKIINSLKSAQYFSSLGKWKTSTGDLLSVEHLKKII